MPSGRYTRIEITHEAYMGLEAEAILQGKTLKRLASELIMSNISQKARRFIRDDGLEDDEVLEQSIDSRPKAVRPKLSENMEAIEEIKRMWAMNPRPSQRDIARKIGYPASTVKYFIKNMIDKGTLRE